MKRRANMPFYTIVSENSYGTSESMKDPELFMHLRDARARCKVLIDADGHRTDYIVVQMDASRLFGDRSHVQRSIEVGDKVDTKVYVFAESETQDLSEEAANAITPESVRSAMYAE